MYIQKTHVVFQKKSFGLHHSGWGEIQMVPAHTTLDSSNSSNETKVSNFGKTRLVCMHCMIMTTTYSKMCTLFILTVI